MAKWFEDGVSCCATCVPRPAAHPAAAAEMTPAFSMVHSVCLGGKDKEGPWRYETHMQQKEGQLLNVGFATAFCQPAFSVTLGHLLLFGA